jgi:transposase
MLYCKKCGYKEGADLNASKNIRDLWNKFHNPERAGCSQAHRLVLWVVDLAYI